MSAITPLKTDLGWIIEVPHDMAQVLGVADGSVAVLHPKAGAIEVEILPPPTDELKATARRINEKHRDAFEEMKRLGGA
jgi:hypothetical protein